MLLSSKDQARSEAALVVLLGPGDPIIAVRLLFATCCLAVCVCALTRSTPPMSVAVQTTRAQGTGRLCGASTTTRSTAAPTQGLRRPPKGRPAPAHAELTHMTDEEGVQWAAAVASCPHCASAPFIQRLALCSVAAVVGIAVWLRARAVRRSRTLGPTNSRRPPTLTAPRQRAPAHLSKARMPSAHEPPRPLTPCSPAVPPPSAHSRCDDPMPPKPSPAPRSPPPAGVPRPPAEPAPPPSPPPATVAAPHAPHTAAPGPAASPPPVTSIALPSPADTLARLRLHCARAAAAGDAVRWAGAALRAPLTHGPAPALAGLRAIELREVAREVNRLHKGRALYVTTVHLPAWRTTCLNAVVRDGAGDLMHLALYNYASLTQPPAEALPVGSRLVLLEPYMKTSRDLPRGAPLLRCDNPQCVVRFRSEAEWRAARRGDPADPSVGDLGAGAAALGERGHGLARAGRYEAALDAYGDAVRALCEPPGARGVSACPASVPLGTPDPVRNGPGAGIAVGDAGEVRIPSLDVESAQSPGSATSPSLSPSTSARLCSQFLAARAQCFLNTGQPARAQAAAERALQADPNDTEAAFWLAEAWLRLQRPQNALRLVQQLESRRPTDRRISEFTQTVVAALEEQQRGQYDLAHMRRDAVAHGGRIAEAHADFASPDVALGVAIPFKGRGVRSTRPLSANQLILGSRAFAVAFPAVENRCWTPAGCESEAASAGRLLVHEVIHKAMARPECATQLYSLDAGPQYSAAPPPQSPAAIVDVDRIRGLCAVNAFRAQGDPWERLTHGPGHVGAPPPPGLGSGLWLRESLLNHSCAPNCTWLQIGDFQFTFTTRAVAAGEELCIAYCAAMPFTDRREALAHWAPGRGFECRCERCAWLRARPALAQVEAEVLAVRDRVWQRMRLQGISMAAAGDAELDAGRRAELSAALQPLPLRQQQPLQEVLLLDAAALEAQGAYGEALGLYQRVADIREAAGVGPVDVEWAMDRCNIARAMLLCGQTEAAAGLLHYTYRTACTPFGRDAAGLRTLALELCQPCVMDSPVVRDEQMRRQLEAQLLQLITAAVQG